MSVAGTDKEESYSPTTMQLINYDPAKL